MIKISTLIKRIYFAFGFVIFSASSAFAERTCPSLSSFIQDGSGDSFLLRPAYEIVRDTCSQVAEKTWNVFAGDLQAVMALGVAIYIALYTLRNIGAFSQQDTSAYLSNEKTGVIPLLLKTAFIIALLSHRDFVYKYLVSPIVGTGMDVGTLVTSSSVFGSSSFGAASDTKGMFTAVIDKAQEFNDKVYSIVAMGRLLLCMAFLPTTFFDWHWVLIPFGLSLYVFGWMLIIFLSFYLLDVLFRLGVGCMVLPFSIACSISKLSIPYTKKTWDIFVNVAFNFMILGVIVSFTMKMIEVALTGGGTGAEGTSSMTSMFSGSEVTDADATAASESIGVMAFVLTSLSFMIAIKLFSSVEDMADQLSSTANSLKNSKGESQGLGKQAGAELAKRTVGAVKEPVEGMAKAAGKEMTDAIADTKVGHALGVGRY